MLGANGIYIERLIEKGCKQRHFAVMFSDSDLERASKIGCLLFTKPREKDAMAAVADSLDAIGTQIGEGKPVYSAG